jgi:hypothetical protein
MIRNITYYQNRINLLASRAGRDNQNIIAKLKRKIRKLQEQ